MFLTSSKHVFIFRSAPWRTAHSSCIDTPPSAPRRAPEGQGAGVADVVRLGVELLEEDGAHVGHLRRPGVERAGARLQVGEWDASEV